MVCLVAADKHDTVDDAGAPRKRTSRRAVLLLRWIMEIGSPRTIHIAAALIDDGLGRLLLVRKAGTPWFMQAGGKIEEGESAICALQRELKEEIGLLISEDDIRPMGRFSSPAANEPGHTVEADIFHVRIDHALETGCEIAEAAWVSHAEAVAMPLAPLTRDHILPLALSL